MSRALLALCSLLAVALPSTAVGQDPASLLVLDDGEERWFTNQYSREPVVIGVTGIGAAQDCERRLVRFTNQTPATSSEPKSVQEITPQWMDSVTGPKCRAFYRWRLGDIPGRQDLQVRLLRLEKELGTETAAAGATQTLHAIAHLPANMIVGLAHPSRSEQDEEERRFQPVVGVDFPLVWRGLARLGAYPALDRARVAVTTAFGRPGEDVYVGLQIMPLLEGPRAAAFPVQVGFGYHWGKGEEGGYVAAYYNATSVLKDALGGLGIK